MPASSASRVLGGLVWFHRWLGIATCLIFAMWFASGAVMLFKPFPSVSAADRLAFADPLDARAIAIAPRQALAAAGAPASAPIRLIQRGGAPAYVIEVERKFVAVDARRGTRPGLLAPATVGADDPPVDYDQWIVPNGIDLYRPVYRITAKDDAGTVRYVSALTGELVQRTTAAERAWNWVGSVLHWVYFTPLRSNWAAWDKTVWALSLGAMLVAIAGIVLGVVRTLTALRLQRRSLTYFRAWWMRWHHLLGLFAGLFVLTWIFSGWLSMDHGRLFSRGEATVEQARAFAGTPTFAGVTVETLAHVGPAKQIAFSSLAGTSILSVARPDGTSERLDAGGMPLGDGQFAALVAKGLDAAWPRARQSAIERVPADDLFRLNEGWPDSVRRVHLDGGPDVYLEADTGRLLTVMDASRRNYAWAYYALHTFKFPGLSSRPALRKTVVLIPLTAGLLFSLTGVVIGWRRLSRKLLAHKRPRDSDAL